MPDTFGGEWRRPSSPQQGRTRRELEDRASFDNEPVTGPGCLLIATICVTALAVVRRRS